jgi:hypothetical protein
MPVIVLGRAGRFAKSATDSEDLGGGVTADYLDTVRGRVTARRASGTLQSRLSVRDASGATVLTCDTGTVSWVARDSYAGRLDFDPMAIETSRDRRRLTSLSSAFRAPCASGGSFLYFGTSPAGPAPAGPVEDGKDVLEPAAISSRGSFAATARGARSIDFGISGFITQRLTGRVGKNGGKGTFTGHVDVSNRTTGEKLDDCDTGLLRWTAIQ